MIPSSPFRNSTLFFNNTNYAILHRRRKCNAIIDNAIRMLNEIDQFYSLNLKLMFFKELFMLWTGGNMRSVLLICVAEVTANFATLKVENRLHRKY